jgi:hypothetical protein
MSEDQSVFYIIPIVFRSPVPLLYYTNPFQKSSPFFILYRSFSEVQSVLLIIPILFRSPVRLFFIPIHVRSPVRLLDYTDSFQKFSPSFSLCRSFLEIQSVFQLIPILFRSPCRLLDFTDPFQKSSPSFRLFQSFS